MFLLWLRQWPQCGDRTPASVPPLAEGRSSLINTPVFPPSSFVLPSFVWFFIFFSTVQVLLSTLSWCSACTSVCAGVFLVYLWREMYSASTYSSTILFSQNWCFWTVVLEKTLECPLDCKEIKSVNPKRNQSWTFIGKTNAEAETPVLWSPNGKNWLTRKDPEAGKDWRQEEKGTTEDEMVGWHHQLNGDEFEEAPGFGDGQGSLTWCDPWVANSWTWVSDWIELN